MSDDTPIKLRRLQAWQYGIAEGQIQSAESVVGQDHVPTLTAELHRGWLGDLDSNCMCTFVDSEPYPCESPECEVTEPIGPPPSSTRIK